MAESYRVVRQTQRDLSLINHTRLRKNINTTRIDIASRIMHERGRELCHIFFQFNHRAFVGLSRDYFNGYIVMTFIITSLLKNIKFHVILITKRFAINFNKLLHIKADPHRFTRKTINGINFNKNLPMIYNIFET